MDGIATLIKESYTQDNIGQFVSEEARTDVFVEEGSITRAEWTSAGRTGFNPEIVLITPFVNYNNETIVEYCGNRYSIYRTYRRGEDIELYLEQKGGTYEKS